MEGWEGRKEIPKNRPFVERAFPCLKPPFSAAWAGMLRHPFFERAFQRSRRLSSVPREIFSPSAACFPRLSLWRLAIGAICTTFAVCPPFFLLKDLIDGSEGIGIRVQISRLRSRYGRFRVALLALKHEGVAESRHGHLGCILLELLCTAALSTPPSFLERAVKFPLQEVHLCSLRVRDVRCS